MKKFKKNILNLVFLGLGFIFSAIIVLIHEDITLIVDYISNTLNPNENLQLLYKQLTYLRVLQLGLILIDIYFYLFVFIEILEKIYAYKKTK